MRVLITGGHGMLARALVRELSDRGHEVSAPGREELDALDIGALDRFVERIRPAALIQCAAYTRVDDAELDEAGAFATNALAAALAAEVCRKTGIRFVYPSTDYVFAGTAARPYAPSDPPAPRSAYGRSKLAGEWAARLAGDFLVVRTAWLYGGGGRSFVKAILDQARRGGSLRVVADQWGSPTWTADLAAVIAALLERSASAGVYHATNSGKTTWHGFASEIARRIGLPGEVAPISSDQSSRRAVRPSYSVLDTSGTEALVGAIPGWEDALGRALQSDFAADLPGTVR